MVHAHYHTLAACPLSCSCLLSVFLFFLSFLLYLSLSCFVVLPPPPPFSCARLWPLLYYLPCRVFTILPLKRFYLGVGVLPYHPLVCQLSNHHHLPVLAVPHPITRQKVLFCLLAYRGIPIRIRMDILSHYLSWHAPSDSNSSFPILSGMSS